MHDLKWLEANLDEAKILFQKRGVIPELDKLISLFKDRRKLILKTEELKRQRNEASDLLKNASKEEIEEKRTGLRDLANNIKEEEKALLSLEEELQNIALNVPNLPLEEVPNGFSEKDNVVLKEVLEKPKFNFAIKDHVLLGEITDTIDFTRAAKVSGARFVFLKGHLARLNRALLQFMCDFHMKNGDIELNTPVLVKRPSMVSTGQFPKFSDDAFKVLKEDDEPYYLIPTAETTVTNYLADEIIDEEMLPLRFFAYSLCFRAEAGAAGRDTRGMIRLHQFEKVEMVRFVKRGQVKEEHEMMVKRASDLLTALKLPHRLVHLCGGDLGFTSENTIDIEVYLPGQECYREISSCSSFGTFQARRAKIRYRGKDKKIEYVVTLNGSGLPLGRTIVAIYENYQQEDGSIKIPEALWPYMGELKEIKPIST